MASGVTVSDVCLTRFQELKLGKKHKFITFKLNTEMTQIVVDKIDTEIVDKPTSTDYEKFLGELKEDECKWAVYDFDYDSGEGKRNKLAFYSWTPDNARIKHKMVFASSKDALRRALVGIALEIQGTDSSEVAYDTVLEKAKKTR